MCKWLTKDRTKTYCGMNAVYVQYRLQVHIRTACNKKKKNNVRLKMIMQLIGLLLALDTAIIYF